MRAEPVYYKAPDGLRLYAHRYGAPDAPLTVLCLHGLTRNHKDFEPMIAALGDRYQYISVDVRGRGQSAWTDSSDQYNPAQYAEDMIALLDYLHLTKLALIGTSMGGLIAMVMMDKVPDRIAGVVMNDVGPAVEQAGLQRISEYASRTPVYETWQTAAAAIAVTQSVAYPDYLSEDWDAFARRTCCETADGRIVPDYDPGIMDNFTTAQPGLLARFGMWRLFAKLKSSPLLILRGEQSDILSPRTANRMVRRHKHSTLITIPGRGHAPMLDEPESVAAIAGFLEGLQAR